MTSMSKTYTVAEIRDLLTNSGGRIRIAWDGGGQYARIQERREFLGFSPYFKTMIWLSSEDPEWEILGFRGLADSNLPKP